MRLHRLFFTFCLLTFFVSLACAQSSYRADIRKGNRFYRDSLFSRAETEYKKSIEKESRNSRALFNLGNTLLFQQKPKDAMKQYEQAVSLENNKMMKAQIYHNMGVIFQSNKQFSEAIECYKNSLRNNPHDDRTRYNMVLCQRQNKGGKNNNNDKDKNKNEQNKDNNKDKQQNKNEQNKEQQKQPKQNKNQMSKDNAEQLLKAAQEEEKRTQQKVKKGLQQSSPRNVEKNW